MVYMHFVHHIVDRMVSSAQIDDIRDPEIQAQFRWRAKEATGMVCGGRYRKRCQVRKDDRRSTRAWRANGGRIYPGFRPGPYLGRID